MNNDNYFPTVYQDFIHKSRYARWLWKEKRRETWQETVGRYFDFFEEHLQEKCEYILSIDERNELEEAVLGLRAMPSMRCLMTAGPALKRENVAGYNCFRGSEEFLTKDGYKQFHEVVGETVEVYTPKGWKPAKVASYGNQKLQRVTFKPSRKTNVRFSVDVTPNHRWLTTNRGEITNLSIGDKVKSNLQTDNFEFIPQAFIRGFGYGDGTLDSRGRAKLRLCGNKDVKWLSVFESYGNASIWSPEKMNGDVLIVYHKGYFGNWKELPIEHMQDINYMKSWLDGYLAADGHVNSKQPGLSSQNYDAIQFVKYIAPMCGYIVTGENTSLVMETNFGIRKNPLTRLTLRNEAEFIVTNIEELDETEEVFCVQEPETHSFTLASGLLTGNCSYVAVDSLRSFDEILYILMNGTGVGFSVEKKYVNQLPIIAEEFYDTDSTVVVADSKLGWAKALKELIHLLASGQIPRWDVSKIRPAGAPLKTFGGRASGPAVLVDLFDFVTRVFRNAAGRRLTTLECHDIVCKIAEIVVVGGVRRSALISLSDLSDDLMRSAKSGQWWESNPQRALANNSFVGNGHIDTGVFLKEWLSLYESKSGERGIFSRTAAQNQASYNGRRDETLDFGTNPCSEIILRNREFCNLSEVVVRATDSVETLKEKVRIATILGTFQSTLTDFRYLSKKWKENCEEERLLGVSLTGIMDNALTNSLPSSTNGMPIEIMANDDYELPGILQELKRVAVETNKEWAEKLGINQSTAITCVKPSGTVSQLVDSASGIHSRHAPYYIRTIRADKKDPLAKLMIDLGFPYEDDVMKPDHTYVFSFPVKSPSDAVYREDRTAIEQLELWKVYQDNWCEHKPSITISVKEDEWVEVGAWVFNNFDRMSGVSFLPFTDHVYKQAPYQDATEEEYKELLEIMPDGIDWNLLKDYENVDETIGSQELACVAGNCEI